MTDPRDLRVNTLDRYEKRSDRLVLESYSSCEVPAGCGGAILRWVDPDEALPLLLTVDFAGRKGEFAVDGDAHRRVRWSMAPGRHVLTIAFDAAPGPLAFRLRLSYAPEQVHASSRRALPTAQLVTLDDGAWFGRTRAPHASWREALDPVDGWLALRAMPAPTQEKRPWFDAQLGDARWIGLSTDGGPVYVRRAFSVTAHERWELT